MSGREVSDKEKEKLAAARQTIQDSVEQAAAAAKKTLEKVVDKAYSSVDQVKYGNLSLTLKLAILLKSIHLTKKIADKVKESLSPVGGGGDTGEQSAESVFQNLRSFIWEEMKKESNIIQNLEQVESQRVEDVFDEILNYWATGPPNHSNAHPNISKKKKKSNI